MASDPSLTKHWDDRYASVSSEEVSWFQADPQVSLRLIESLPLAKADPIVDVGGGASLLVDRLCDSGFTDVTVVDLSAQALQESRARVDDPKVEWVVADIRHWQPTRQFALWHDRAALHFLTEAADQAHYWSTASASIVKGGHVIVGVFAQDGPTMCSGLPVHRYDFDELAAAMAADFDVLRTEHEQHVTPSGAVQSFNWILGRRR